MIDVVATHGRGYVAAPSISVNSNKEIWDCVALYKLYTKSKRKEQSIYTYCAAHYLNNGIFPCKSCFASFELVSCLLQPFLVLLRL